MQKDSGVPGRRQNNENRDGPTPKKPDLQKKDTKRSGDLAELTFVLKTASLGITASKPYGDRRPYDFLVECGPRLLRVQVKSVFTVRDGHHRVSVARALGRDDIDAYVTEVKTRVDADQATRLADLPLKSHERVFFERVPLPAEARDEIQLSDLEDYALLAEMVEAWGFRAMQSRGEAMNRRQNAILWLETEFRPVVEMLQEAGLIGARTDAEAYMRIAGERYWLLRTHEWSDEVLQQVIEGKGRWRHPER